MDQFPFLKDQQSQDFQREIYPLGKGFDAIGDHVVITDKDGFILYANKAAERHTGFSVSEMAGKKPGDLWGGKMPKEFYGNMWHIIKEIKRPFRGEVENRKRDGTKYWQELRIFPLLDEKGESKFFIGMEPDITIRKIFEKHNRQHVEEMERLITYMEERELKIKELSEEVLRLRAQSEKSKN